MEKELSYRQREAVAVFTGHALNKLWEMEDGCCPDCCLPCSHLRELSHVNELDDIVQPYAAAENYQFPWWFGRETGGVSVAWLYGHLRKGRFNCPNHDHLKARDNGSQRA